MHAHVSEFSGSLNQVTLVVLLLAAFYVGFAIGAPWLLYDAPPSAQDLFAANGDCETATANPFAQLR